LRFAQNPRRGARLTRQDERLGLLRVRRFPGKLDYMKKSVRLGAMAGLAVAASACAQHSAWLPEARKLVVTPSYVYQDFDEVWLGKNEVGLSGDLWQHAAFLGFDYGITEDIAVDLTVGWVWSETDAQMPGLGPGADNLTDDGLADTGFGIRKRFIDETDFDIWCIPSLAMRAGGIIAGTYDENFPFSAGDGAYAAEVSLLGGKTIFTGFGWYGDVGYRYRDGVPDDFFGAAGLFVSWKFLSLTAGYRFTEGLSGPDIGEPEFTFPEVKEISQNIEASLGFTDPGGRHYQVFYAHTIDGRNTGKRDIFGAALSLTW
jgi:hypothetical protein